MGWEIFVVTTCPLPPGAVLVPGAGVVLLFSFGSQATVAVAGLLVGNHIVDASSLVSFYHPWLQTLLNPFAGWCVV